MLYKILNKQVEIPIIPIIFRSNTSATRGNNRRFVQLQVSPKLLYCSNAAKNKYTSFHFEFVWIMLLIHIYLFLNE